MQGGKVRHSRVLNTMSVSANVDPPLQSTEDCRAYPRNIQQLFSPPESAVPIPEGEDAVRTSRSDSGERHELVPTRGVQVDPTGGGGSGDSPRDRTGNPSRLSVWRDLGWSGGALDSLQKPLICTEEA